MAASVHGNVGHRATTVDRKVVFKSVLDNPFKIKWPQVPLNLQNAALASLVTILTGIAEYHTARQSASRKRKRARHDKARKEKHNVRKKRKASDGNPAVVLETKTVETEVLDALEEHTTLEPTGMDVNEDDNAPEINIEPIPAPPILSHITFGINEVTKRLENQSQSLRLHTSVLSSGTSTVKPASSLTYVFVCRADVDPPLLIAHLPELVAACNVPSSAKSGSFVHLIPLPKNAEHILAETVALRRVSVLALDSTTPSLATLTTLLSSIPPPSAPWLTNTITTHVPTHIKQLRTTAPRDMRATKRTRTESRRAIQQANKRTKHNYSSKQKGTRPKGKE